MQDANRLASGLRDLGRRGAPGDSSRMADALSGRAVIAGIAETGIKRDENPEVELVLTVDLPGREPYRATVRQVVSRFVLHTLAPGASVPVRVDSSNPGRLEIG